MKINTGIVKLRNSENKYKTFTCREFVLIELRKTLPKKIKKKKLFDRINY